MTEFLCGHLCCLWPSDLLTFRVTQLIVCLELVKPAYFCVGMTLCMQYAVEHQYVGIHLLPNMVACILKLGFPECVIGKEVSWLYHEMNVHTLVAWDCLRLGSLRTRLYPDCILGWIGSACILDFGFPECVIGKEVSWLYHEMNIHACTYTCSLRLPQIGEPENKAVSRLHTGLDWIDLHGWELCTWLSWFGFSLAPKFVTENSFVTV